MIDKSKEIRVIEWFSGIGGMHYALKLAGIPATIVAAIDINETANRIYQHNFHHAPVTKNIENLSLKWIEQLESNAWLMSPPCQPYTQGGKQRDDKDGRAGGFLHLLNVLLELMNPPEFIFLENVPYFEMSNCHAMLLQILTKKLNYIVEEYMIAPTDPIICIPNRRKRYYMSARRCDAVPLNILESNISVYTEAFGFDNQGKIIQSLKQVMSDSNLIGYPRTKKLDSYLEQLKDIELQKYLVPFSYINSAKDFRFDIVNHSSPSCATFTKAYGTKYVIGSGSFLQTKEFDLEYEPDDQEKLILLGLRFFTPLEIAALHAFPMEEFSFPDDILLIHKYRTLGNGLNVAVVASLLHRLFFANIHNHFNKESVK